MSPRSSLLLATTLILGGCLRDGSWTYEGDDECVESADTLFGCNAFGTSSSGSGGGSSLPPIDWDHRPITLRSVAVSGTFADAIDLRLEPVHAEAYRSFEADFIEVVDQPREGRPIRIVASIRPGFWVQSMQPGSLEELDADDLADESRWPRFSFRASTETPDGQSYVASARRLDVGVSSGSTPGARTLGFSAELALDDGYGTSFGVQTLNLLFEVENPEGS